MTRPRLSAVLITKNAQAHLDECLAALEFADEIVVLDSGSTDDTLMICRAHGARVVTTPDWPGFGPQKNRAIALVNGDWVLSIDADEVVTPALRDEIQATLRAPSHGVYEMPRLSSFCGHFMRHGGWWPDRVARLFRRGAARFSDDAVHERLVFAGAAGRLASHLIHYTYDDFSQALEKLNRYSTLGAQQAFAAGKRATPLTAWTRGAWAFLRSYLLRHGFLDGTAGWLLARYNAQTTFYKYLKLWQLGARRRGGTDS